MKHTAAVLTLGLAAAAGANPSTPTDVAGELGALTSEESRMLERIKTIHPDFHFTKQARRYFDIVDGDRQLVYSEVQFEAVDGLILGEFMSYHVGFPASLESVHFSYDAGTAYRGFGSIHVTDEAITRVETTCGTAGCSQEVLVNGERVYPDT